LCCTSHARPQAAPLLRNVEPSTANGRFEVSWLTGGGAPPRVPAALHTDADIKVAPPDVAGVVVAGGVATRTGGVEAGVGVGVVCSHGSGGSTQSVLTARFALFDGVGVGVGVRAGAGAAPPAATLHSAHSP
jgi:hypothetical protein